MKTSHQFCGIVQSSLGWALFLGLLAIGLMVSPVAAQPFAYVALSGANGVAVLATSSNTVVATVPVGQSPTGVAITPDGAHVYVTNEFSNSVSVLATANNAVVATVPVGQAPTGVAITPDGAHVYVANSASGSYTVSVLATASNTVVATVPLPAGNTPTGLAIAPDGSHVYVTTGEGVVVLETASNTVVSRVLSAGFDGIALTPDGAHAYLIHRQGGFVSVLDTAKALTDPTNAVVAVAALGGFAWAVAVTPDGAHVYVTNAGGGTISVTVLSTASNSVVAYVTDAAGGGVFGVAFTSDGSSAYVTNGFLGTVSVLDTGKALSDPTHAVVATFPVGSGPVGIALATGASRPPPTACGCSLTGSFDDPSVVDPAVGANGASPQGKYTLIASGGNGSPFSLSVSKGGATVLTVSLPASATFPYAALPPWGFSPDDDRFIVHYVNQGLDTINLYNLAGSNPQQPTWTSSSATGVSSVGFSPHGHYVMAAYLNHSIQSITLSVVDAQSAKVAYTNQFPFVVAPGPIPDADAFGSAGWGFSSDSTDRTFVYAYSIAQTTIQWDAVNLKAQLVVASELISAPAAFWQFSRCGDALGLVTQDNNSTQIDVRIFSTTDGTTTGERTPPFGPAVLLTTPTSQIVAVTGTAYVVAPNAALSGCPPPTTHLLVQPGVAAIMTLPNGAGQITFPADLVSSPTTFTYTEVDIPAHPQGSFAFAGRAFALTATDSSGGSVSSFPANYTITLSYTQKDLQALGIAASQFNLFFWNGSAWSGVLPCPGCGVDTANQQLTAVLNHLTDFALLGVRDTTPPAITVSATPPTLWPPSGNMVPVTVSGTMTDNEPTGVGVKASKAAYAVTDEYGSVQPSGPITLGSDGSYSFTIQLQASRNDDDFDGRQYTITVTAPDYAGNVGSASTVVTVPHDQGH